MDNQEINTKNIKSITEKEFNETALNEKVESDNELKEWLVNYCGNNANPENDEVTVETIVGVVAEQFPEFLMAVAEENWTRGYHQALIDVEVGENIVKNETNDNTDE